MESGGNYKAVGPTHPKMGRALGAYQVMEANLPKWSQEVLGQRLTPAQFLNSPQAQDAIAHAKMQQAFDQYGNMADVTSTWHSGRGYEGNTRRDVNMSTKDYTHKVASIFNKASES